MKQSKCIFCEKNGVGTIRIDVARKGVQFKQVCLEHLAGPRYWGEVNNLFKLIGMKKTVVPSICVNKKRYVIK